MKKGFFNLLFLFFVVLIFSSCGKDKFDYPNQYSVVIDGIPYSGNDMRYTDEGDRFVMFLGDVQTYGYQFQFGHDGPFSGTGTYTDDDYLTTWYNDDAWICDGDYNLTITEYKQGEYIRGSFYGTVKTSVGNSWDYMSVSGEFSYSE